MFIACVLCDAKCFRLDRGRLRRVTSFKWFAVSSRVEKNTKWFIQWIRREWEAWKERRVETDHLSGWWACKEGPPLPLQRTEQSKTGEWEDTGKWKTKKVITLERIILQTQTRAVEAIFVLQIFVDPSYGPGLCFFKEQQWGSLARKQNELE